MPSSGPRRSPRRTLSAMGFSRWSVMVKLAIGLQSTSIQGAFGFSKGAKGSNAPNRRGSAPEQKKQQTNIAVHGEKRSVEPAEIIGIDQGMLVEEQRGYHGDAEPCRPGQTEGGGQQPEKKDQANVHRASNEEGIGDAKAAGYGKQTGALVEFDVLACVRHVQAPGPQGNRGVEEQHAQIETPGDGDPSCGRGDSQGKAEEEM